MVKNTKTTRRAPNQPFVYTGKQTVPKQYDQFIPVEQTPMYYGNQQEFYPAPYTSYENTHYYIPREIHENVSQLRDINTQSQKPRSCTNQRIAACFFCIGAGLLIVTAFVVPVVVILTLKTETSESTDSLPFGSVQINYNPSSLPSSWSLCYSATYQATLGTTNLPTILSTCNKKMLLVGCRATGNTVLDVAAVGYRADVLYNCTTINSCRNVANGVGWYYSDSYSWGFANGTDSVSRSSCDTTWINPNYRICWHTQNNNGYRCGSTVTSGKNYEKVIYHSN